MSQKPAVLITGPGGRIGPLVLPRLREQLQLRLLDKNPLPFPDETIQADLSDQSVLERACAGMEAVLHLAATSDEAPFLEELVPNNVEGLYRLFEAARLTGVRRVVFASTVQTIGHNPPGTVEPDQLPNPVSLYGATKLLGEAMGRYYWHKHKIEFVAVRIGWFQDYAYFQSHRQGRDLWLSPRDAAEIFLRCLTRPGLENVTLFATSLTENERVSRAPLQRWLDYVPQDRARDYPYKGDE